MNAELLPTLLTYGEANQTILGSIHSLRVFKKKKRLQVFNVSTFASLMPNLLSHPLTLLMSSLAIFSPTKTASWFIPSLGPVLERA